MRGARARSAPAFGAERVARGGDPAATGARARSAHAIGAERVTRGDAGSQCAVLRSLAAPLSHAPVHGWEAPAFQHNYKQQGSPDLALTPQNP